MEELMEMRSLLEAGRYPEALLLLAEMEEMSRDDKINKIEAYLHVLLLHLIKQQAEHRTTRSWNLSIRNATRDILRSWKRRKAGGYYLSEEELRAAIDEVFADALGRASLEAFGGSYSEKQFQEMVEAPRIKAEALRRLLAPCEADNDIDSNDLKWLQADSDLDSDIPQWLK